MKTHESDPLLLRLDEETLEVGEEEGSALRRLGEVWGWGRVGH